MRRNAPPSFFDPNLFYTRTEKGVEIDLLLKKEGHLYPFEIKSSMTPYDGFGKHLKAFTKAEESASAPRVVYAGEPYSRYGGVEYVQYRDIASCVI